MVRKIALLIYNILFFFFRIFDFLFNKKIAYAFKDLAIDKSYEYIFIKKKKIFFFIPNSYTKYRLETFFTKEPDTLKWINNFKKNSIFFDIGANVGIYSIYASIIKPSTKIFSFEPSFLNTKVLSRNISINQLSKKISIIQLPLSDKKIKFNKCQSLHFKKEVLLIHLV